MKRRQHDREEGFTLVELAAVIVIIALMIGGVLLGRHMVRASQLNGILVDKDRYIAAVAQFQQKYSALPGDFREAETYWGSDASCPATAYNTVKKSATCNGDGNGKLGDSTFYEWLRVWQQLSDAGFINETFTGTEGSAGSVYHTVPGLNAPTTGLDGATFLMRWLSAQTADTDWYNGSYGHVMIFGAQNPNLGMPKYPIITAAEAYSLDAKVDDGLPGSGSIWAWKSTSTNAPGCTTTDVNATAAYAVTSGGILCSFVFVNIF